MTTIEKNNTTLNHHSQPTRHSPPPRHSRESGNPVSLITNNLDIWSSATQTRKGVGRGSSKKLNLYGIKKLRELILELAVRGLLVPQNPDDEPASVLLKKITAEKDRLIKEKKIKKQKPLPEISEDEIPFNLANGWLWVRLGNVGITSTGKTPSTKISKYFDGNIPFIGPGQITPKGELLEPDKTLTELGVKFSFETNAGDILMVCIGGSIGKSVITDKRVTFNQQINAIQPIFITSSFLYSVMTTNLFYESVLEKASGSATPIINRSKWEELLVPLAPLAEQNRIVTKVDELMALCDQLEQQQENSITAHKILVETLLSALTNAADKGAFEQAWEKIANHFDTLFTTEHSIEQLKQTILQLAVMGKLVPQDPNDESASVLLEKIAAEKKRLIKEKKIKKQKELSEINEEEKSFESPNGWVWCHLLEVVYLLGDGLHGTPEYTDNGKYYFVNGNNLKDGKIIIKHETKTVAQDQYDKYKKKLGDNTVLVSINGTLGSVAFYDNENIVLGKSACYFNLAENIYKKYIKTVICSSYFIEYAFRNASGSTIKNLGLKAMNNLPIALPPKNEQYRIVEKVDNLMSLCDQLKINLNNAQTTQIHLANVVTEQPII